LSKRLNLRQMAFADGITVSIVSHRQGDLIKHLLEDLQRLCNANVSKIVIVQNLPEDSSYTELSSKFGPESAIPIVLIKNPHPLGFAANHNRAFEECDTRYFAVLNPDLRLIDDPFSLLKNAFNQARVGMVCPRLLNSDMTLQDSARDLITPISLLRRVMFRRRESKAEWLSGAFMLFNSQVFHELDGFDDKFRLYCEDTDICLRLRLLGYRFVQFTKATVQHQAQRATKTSAQHLIWHLSSFARLWTSGTFWRYLMKRSSFNNQQHD
jgi:N-acetylglucosaminyl-diphospho-decaprenol L-rhamnosyltransferase